MPSKREEWRGSFIMRLLSEELEKVISRQSALGFSKIIS
jgi:hypothetical protein